MRTHHSRACTNSQQCVGHEILLEADGRLVHCSTLASPEATLSGLSGQAAHMHGKRQKHVLTIDTKLVIHCIRGVLFLTA